MFRKMRWRIAVPYMILILVTMVGLLLYVSITLQQRYILDLENKLVTQTNQISQVLPLISTNLDPLEVNKLAGEWAEVLDARVTIIDKAGEVIGESHEDFSVMENHLNRPEIQEALNNSFGSSTRFSRTVGYRMMYVAVPINLSGEIEGFARVAVPTTQIDDSIRSMQRGLIFTTILLLAIAFLIAVIIANATSKPLQKLVENAVDLSKRNGISQEMDQYLKPSKKGEIDQLTSIIETTIHNINLQMERVQAESTKMNEVLDHMTDGVIIADAQGRIQLINPAAAHIFEIDSNEAIGRSIAEVLRHHQLIELWQRCQESDQLQSISMEVGLEKSYLNGIATPLDKGMPGGTLLLFQDLTRVKKMEIIRRDFVSNISHELRTPLASLKALVETILDNALEDPSALRKFLEQADIEVDSLIQIVTELMELSKIESGKVTLNLESIRPDLVINTAVGRLKLHADRSEVKVQINCPENLSPVLADRERIERVLVNLLHNAIKFTPSGGEIEISAKEYSENDEQYILFSILDTGIGISETDLPRIFERFYKSDRARSSGGTGLGLAIAQHIVLIHNGKIWVESVQGEGSTFYFTVPTVS